jgi:uncharacterized protein (TIGR03437 family)
MPGDPSSTVDEMFKYTFLLAAATLSLAPPAFPQTISLFAGGGDPKAAAPYGDGGPAVSATLQAPAQTVFDGSGNAYIADTFHQSIRKVNAAGTISTFIGGSAAVYTEGAVASKTVLGIPYGLAVIGNALYFSDGVWNSIRKVDLDTNIVTTVAGSTGLSGITSPGFSGDGGPAVGAKLNLPRRLGSNGKNLLYCFDSQNFRIRVVDLSTGLIKTVAGNGKTIFNGTNGEGQIATNASLSFDEPFTLDPAGNLYVADPYRLRKVDAVTNIITTIGGTGNAGNGFAPDGALAVSSAMRLVSIASDGGANIFYQDFGKSIYQIRRIDAKSGTLSTVAGNKIISTVSSGDGGPALSAGLLMVYGLDFDVQGNLFLSDQSSEFHVREIGLLGVPFAGTSAPGAPVISSGAGSIVNGGNLTGAVASGSFVTIYGQDLSATTRTWASADFVDGNLPLALDGISVTINGKAAFVYYISPTQINVLAASDATIGPVPVQVTTARGTSAAVTVNKAKASPAFFQFDPQGRKYIAAVNLDGTYAGPAGLYGAALVTRPAKPGEIVQLFATGLGATAPAYPDGKLFSGAFALAVPPTVTIGGKSADVAYAGLTGAGLYQLNVVIPAVPAGDAEVIVDLGDGLRSTAKVSFLAVSN